MDIGGVLNVIKVGLWCQDQAVAQQVSMTSNNFEIMKQIELLKQQID